MKQKPFDKARRFAALALASLLALAAAGCNQTQPVQADEGKGVIPVSVQNPETGDIALKTEFIGTVKPDQSINVLPKTAGTVLKVYHQVGDTVKEGDLLFEIDPEDLMYSINVAQATYEATLAQVAQTTGSSFQTQLNNADSAYDSAYDALETTRDTYDQNESKLNATVDAARADAQQKYDRWQDLLQQAQSDPTLGACADAAEIAYNEAQVALAAAQATANQTLDSLDSAIDSARRNFNNAKRAYDTLQKDTSVELDNIAQATLRQAEASLESSLHQLENTKVYAPIDGVIEQKNVEEQNMVSTSSPAFVISNKDILTVNFNVSAAAVAGLSEGDAVTIENGGRSYSGTIIEVDQMVDAQTGLFGVRATIEGGDAELYTGLSVKVTAVTQQTAGAQLVPQDAVYYEDGAPYVYLAVDGQAVKTPVTVGITNENQVEVTEGLSADAQVITSWHPNLIDGAAVQVAGQEG